MYCMLSKLQITKLMINLHRQADPIFISKIIFWQIMTVTQGALCVCLCFFFHCLHCSSCTWRRLLCDLSRYVMCMCVGELLKADGILEVTWLERHAIRLHAYLHTETRVYCINIVCLCFGWMCVWLHVGLPQCVHDTHDCVCMCDPFIVYMDAGCCVLSEEPSAPDHSSKL